MPTEESPLLRSQRPYDAVYDRFSCAQKRGIVLLVSFCGLIPLFVSGSFIPCIPDIAKDMNSTGKIISLAVSLSLLTNATGCLLWASYSSFYGRRPIYIASLICQIVGSLGVAFAGSIPELLALRILQAFGSSSGLSIGVAVIGDIYRVEQRGTASGIFFGAVCLGPALAPLAGGFAAQYYSWRSMQAALSVCGVLILLVVLPWLPETMHPGTRGVDQVDEEKSRIVVLNPLKSLMVFRSPNVFLTGLGSAVILMSNFGLLFILQFFDSWGYSRPRNFTALLVPIAYTLGKRYQIDNAAVLGALFIPSGIGNILGSSGAGKLSDLVVIRCRARRGGFWVPEDRLKVTLIGGCILVPLSMLGVGFFTTYVDGTAGIVLNLVCLFMNGLGVDFVLCPAAAYNIDIFHSRSAEVAAASMAFRGLFLATCSAGILPMIDSIGVLASYIIIAVLCWLASICFWLVIQYGDRMRAYVDMGYSVPQDD